MKVRRRPWHRRRRWSRPAGGVASSRAGRRPGGTSGAARRRGAAPGRRTSPDRTSVRREVTPASAASSRKFCQWPQRLRSSRCRRAGKHGSERTRASIRSGASTAACIAITRAETVPHQHGPIDLQGVDDGDQVAGLVGRRVSRRRARRCSRGRAGRTRSPGSACASTRIASQRNQIDRSPVTPWIRTTSGPDPLADVEVQSVGRESGHGLFRGRGRVRDRGHVPQRWS